MDTGTALAAAIDHHRNGRLDEAGRGYDAVLAAEPDNVHALSVSAILMFQRRRTDEAVARLTRAIALAPQAAGLHNNLANIYRETDRPKQALEHYVEAVKLEPGHIEAICNIGLMYRRLDKLEEAIASFFQALEIDPFHVETNHNLAMTYFSLGMAAEAADHVERCYEGGRIPVVDPLWHVAVLTNLGRHERAREVAEMHAKKRPDDPIARHHLAALKGEAVARAPDDYVRTHFDQFASSFDLMLKRLDYRAPQLIAEQLGVLCGNASVGVMLDLGCGTGLLGPLVRRHARHLVGVDLSGGMLARAQARETDGKPTYDQLVEAELTQFLRDLPESGADIALSADTLCYFGPLEEVLAACHRALRPGGAMIASLEHQEDDGGPDHRLLDSGRYSHSEPYVLRVAAASGFTVRGIRLVNLRKEFGRWIRGIVCILENGAKAA